MATQMPANVRAWMNAGNTVATNTAQITGPLMIVFGLIVTMFAYHPDVAVEVPELYVHVSRFAFVIMAGGLLTVFGHREKFE